MEEGGVRLHLKTRLAAALSSPLSPPVYVHGPPSAGKHATVAAAVADYTDDLRDVDCIVSHTDKLLFARLAPLGTDPPPADAAALVTVLAAQRVEPRDRREVFVLSHAERLTSPTFSPSVLHVVFNLPSLARRPDLRIVLVSRVPLSALRHAHSLSVPAATSIFFPRFTEKETLATMRYDPSRISERIAPVMKPYADELYTGFAKFAVALLYPQTSSPLYIRRVVDALFPSYITPTCTSEDPTDFRPDIAFNRVRDRLSTMLFSLDPLQNTITTEKEISSFDNTDAQDDESLLLMLPHAARLLLVAAHLAAVTDPRQDTRFFTAESTRRRASMKGSTAARGSVLDVMNRAFPLERLLAIFHAILPEQFPTPAARRLVLDENIVLEEAGAISPVIASADLVHLSALLALGWLVKDGMAADPLSEPRFRARVTEQQARNIAQSLNVEISRYYAVL